MLFPRSFIDIHLMISIRLLNLELAYVTCTDYVIPLTKLEDWKSFRKNLYLLDIESILEPVFTVVTPKFWFPRAYR